jgi:hypothetical protein
MAENRIRKLGWLAPLALVGAVGVAACGGDEDASDTVRTASVEASRGSDQHLFNLAAEIEASSAVEGSDVHLHNQAAEIEASSAVEGSDVHLHNQAAEAAEQQAQLDNAAETYGDDGMPNPWEAGNRAAQEALDEESSNDEFVPGTGRVPVM